MGPRHERQCKGHVLLLSGSHSTIAAHRGWNDCQHSVSLRQRWLPGLAHYSASKYAVIGFTNSLAKELAREEITVNAICPGVVRTAMWDLLAEQWRNHGETAEESWQRQVLAFVPQGRPQTAEDIGDLVVYLASARNLTGQAINVDGGLTSH